MLFNSIDFAVFLPIVFAVHWSLARIGLRSQNAWLLLASMVFYGWWDARYLVLVLFSAALDFTVGLRLPNVVHTRERKILLAISLIGNLGLLGFFKYYDFFVVSFTDAFSFFGMPIEARTLGLVLPVGISFYTFQSLSYTIDVYRRQLVPTRDPITFGAYVLFFPQLVAGPIERATALIPQFQKPRVFNPIMAADGLRQMLWGLFKKVAVADQCAPLVDAIFADHANASGSTLLVGAVLFTFQIYGDFSGYSDIAIGCARLFGFDLMRNFAFPFFSRDISEFWRRWHISLNTWFRDYLYIPLGGSRGSMASKVRNTFIIFLVSGFWHGANWTFVVWGGLNALYFLPLMLSAKNRTHLGTVAEGRSLPSPRESMGMLWTFGLTVFAFIFFRSDDVGDGLRFIQGIVLNGLWSRPDHINSVVLIMLALMIFGEWMQRTKQHGLEIAHLNRPLRWAIYLPLVFLVVSMSGERVSFIYFQF
jgi:D-alanyl-lipoteichoic acid acyltransferase DltB (MBOAT superfamily)